MYKFEQELKHAEYLHAEIVKIIDDYKQKNGEPPADMLAVYNYLHNEQIEKVTKVKLLLMQYK